MPHLSSKIAGSGNRTILTTVFSTIRFVPSAMGSWVPSPYHNWHCGLRVRWAIVKRQWHIWTVREIAYFQLPQVGNLDRPIEIKITKKLLLFWFQHSNQITFHFFFYHSINFFRPLSSILSDFPPELNNKRRGRNATFNSSLVVSGLCGYCELTAKTLLNRDFRYQFGWVILRGRSDFSRGRGVTVTDVGAKEMGFSSSEEDVARSSSATFPARSGAGDSFSSHVSSISPSPKLNNRQKIKIS